MSKDKKYNKKRQLKAVSFLREEHKEVLEYANNLDDFSSAVRGLLKLEMEKENEIKIQGNKRGIHAGK